VNVAFFFLLWISSPSGGHSKIFGAKADCEKVREETLAASDTLYLSQCVEMEMQFVKGVKQDYQRPSNIWTP
jgi:hypothetical protein